MPEHSAGLLDFRTKPLAERGYHWVFTRVAILWVLSASLYVLWEAHRYIGLYALLAEWQYDNFGHHLPALSFALLLALFASPAAGLLVALRAIDRRRFASRSFYQATIGMSSSFAQILMVFAIGLAGAAVATLCYTQFLPRVAQPERRIALGSPHSFNPAPGNVSLEGEILYDRTAAFAQDLVVTTRGIRFAPMVPTGSNSKALRYFVELPSTEQSARVKEDARQPRAGVLMRNSLPGSIVRLYRYAGFEVQPPYYVLYISSATIRAPYYVAAAQLAVVALLAFVAALIQRRYVRRLAPIATVPEFARTGPQA
jgi:hypothetical protein